MTYVISMRLKRARESYAEARSRRPLQTMLSLRFPGNGMCTQVPCGARIQIFPELPDDADPTVECVVGPPGACVYFEVKRASLIVLPHSLFTLRLLSGVGVSENTVRLEEENPRLFPVVFGYLNHLASGSLNTGLPVVGLPAADYMELWRLVDFLGVIPPLPSLLKVARSSEVLPFVFKAGGEIQTVDAFFNGVLVCRGKGCLAKIDLKMVPIDAPWPVSLMADYNLFEKRFRIDYTPPSIQRDETDETAHGKKSDMPLYPYPIDFKDTFFIPTAAINAQLVIQSIGKYHGPERYMDVICEGVFDIRDNSIRIDAVDKMNYSRFWLSVKADLE